VNCPNAAVTFGGMSAENGGTVDITASTVSFPSGLSVSTPAVTINGQIAGNFSFSLYSNAVLAISGCTSLGGVWSVGTLTNDGTWTLDLSGCTLDLAALKSLLNVFTDTGTFTNGQLLNIAGTNALLDAEALTLVNAVTAKGITVYYND